MNLEDSVSAGTVKPLVSAVHLSIFRSTTDLTSLQAKETSWAAVVETLAAPKTWAKKKSDLPLLKLAKFGNKRTERGGLRHNDNVLSITGIEADYDQEILTVEQVAQLLSDACVEAVVYSSPSHMTVTDTAKGGPRCRIVCPLSKEYPPEARSAFVGRLNRVLGGVLAVESFVLSQTFFYGRVEGVPYEAKFVSGACLDELVIEPLFPDNTTTLSVSTDPLMDYKPAHGVAPDEVRALLDQLNPDMGREPWLKVGMALSHEFSGSLEGLALWDEWSRGSAKYNAGQPIERVWESFKREGIGAGPVVTLSTVRKMVKDAQPTEHEAKSKATLPAFTQITLTELDHAPLYPRVICHDLLYADVRVRLAAGGVGKTTLALMEAMTLALGRDLWGRIPPAPVKTVIITREDGRSILVARLRELMRAAALSREQQQQVLTNVVIYDLSSQSVRLSCIKGDTVVPHYDNIDALSEVLTPFKPDWIIFDPLVSFGVGEQRVNDAEQGLIESFRILRNRFDACIEAIHHVGKVNGRERSTDQYSGRGGSALPDGSRMVAVLTPIDAGEWRKRTGTELEGTQSGILLSLPKLSFCRPQSDVLILRDGYAMSQVVESVVGVPTIESNAQIVLAHIEAQYRMGRRHSRTALSDLHKDIGLSRNAVRSAIQRLEDDKRIETVGSQGVKGTHLAPVTSASRSGGSADK